ncbi:MAG: cyclic nucleotide-binding domain-containing protein, partial [Rhodoferax sp.]|nr:cyclic nucleotide-binding domain-containing protein [Rhodoferax sp.]
MKTPDSQENDWPALLSGSPLFNGVDFTVIAAELRQSQPLCIEHGQVLLDPKRINDDFYIVLDGELLVCLAPRVQQPLVRLRVGDCVGELSIIDNSPPSAYVMAAVKTHL